MTRASKKIQVSGPARPGSSRRSAQVEGPEGSLPLTEEPAARYLVRRQLSGELIRLNLDGLKLNIYRASAARQAGPPPAH